MSRTVFYALDPTRLTEGQQELADTFAQLHALTSEQPDGPVAKIVIADLMLALEAWNLVGEGERRGPHRAAVARILAAIGEESTGLE
jgi:hypothetical protein